MKYPTLPHLLPQYLTQRPTHSCKTRHYLQATFILLFCLGTPAQSIASVASSFDRINTAWKTGLPWFPLDLLVGELLSQRAIAQEDDDSDEETNTDCFESPEEEADCRASSIPSKEVIADGPNTTLSKTLPENPSSPQHEPTSNSTSVQASSSITQNGTKSGKPEAQTPEQPTPQMIIPLNLAP